MADTAAGAGGAAGGAGAGATVNGVGGGAQGNAGQQAMAQLRDARRRLGALGQEAEQLKEQIAQLNMKAETADTLAAEVKRLKAELAGKDEQHATERSLFSAGLTDPDELELVKFAHGRLPEKDRPKLSEWVDSLRKDPTKAPKLIEPIASRWKSSGKDGKAAGGSGSGGAQNKRPQIRPNRGVVDSDGDGAAGQPTEAEFEAANAAAARGDRRSLDQLRERMGLPARPRRR